MKLRLLCENVGMVPRLRAKLYGMADGGDAAIFWWNPTQQRAFISVGDWASPKRWVQAIAPLVGRRNIETTHEGGPGYGMHEGGQGAWIVVRDYRRIKDNFGMTPERRLEIGMDQPVMSS